LATPFPFQPAFLIFFCSQHSEGGKGEITKHSAKPLKGDCESIHDLCNSVTGWDL